MKTAHTLILAVLLAPLFALADPVKFKNQAELVVFRANVELVADGSVERVIDQGKDIYGNKLPEKAVRTPFELSGKTRLTLVKNLAVLTAEEKRLEEARQSIIKGHGITNDTPEKDPQRVAATKKINELFAEPITVDLTKIALEDLNLDKNPLGSTVVQLAALVNELSPPTVAPAEKVAKK